MTEAEELDALLQRCNAVRTRWLQPEARLASAAQRHATDLAAGGFLSHGGSDGSTLAQRVEAAGYRWDRIGENVLCRTLRDADGAFAQWWNSEGHRANLLGDAFVDVGMGLAYSPRVDCWYYTMVLAAPAR